MSAGRGPASSGARLLGDDYQHLLTWLHAAKLVHRDPEVVRVELEKHGAGNIDDLVVHRVTGPGEYHQVKFVRNPAREPLTADWFTDPGDTKQSPLQRFHASWKMLTVNGQTPFMVLHTNRLISGDPAMACIDGKTELLVPRFAVARSRSAMGKIRQTWAEHLEAEEADLLAMLSDLRIRAARVSVEELREHCRYVMDASGLLNTALAVEEGMLVARGWVQDGIRDVDAGVVSEVVKERKLRAAERRATVLIQAIDRDVYPELATVALDWVADFVGEAARTRREPADPAAWSTRFASELADAERAVAAQGYREVRLAGAFRLATGVFAGTTFSDTRSYQVLIPGRSGDGTWTGDIASYGDRRQVGVTCSRRAIGDGDELAIGLSISGDLEAAVVKHLEAAPLPVRELAHFTLPRLGTDALSDGDAVRGWVAEVRDVLRQLSEEGWSRFHVFMYGPITAAVLLGHSWNRMPPTQLWDDRGPGRGYLPAFEISG